MDPATSPPSWRYGSKSRAWRTFAVHPIPQTQGKIEPWHQTLKNRILLENYYLPGDLEAHFGRFVEHYNHRRYHESLKNLTPADVYFGRGQSILKMRERIKQKAIQNRLVQHQRNAA